MDLGTHATHFLAEGSGPCIVRAVGLLTCASVIYYNNAGDAYVHHANAGDVGQGDFNSDIAALGGVAGNVWVVYAHNNNTDNGYQATLTDIVNWGVATNHVTEVTNLRVPGFGINNLGWVGY